MNAAEKVIIEFLIIGILIYLIYCVYKASTELEKEKKEEEKTKIT